MTTYHFVAGDAMTFDEDGGLKRLGRHAHPPGHASDIRTSIVVYDNPGGEDIRYLWHRRKYKFNCREQEHEQSLTIDLLTRDTHDDRPRFYFVRIKPEPALSGLVQGCDFYDGRDWHAATGDFPMRTSSIRIRTKLPYDHTMFSFVAVVRDARERRNKNCDPQIGNGPP